MSLGKLSLRILRDTSVNTNKDNNSRNSRITLEEDELADDLEPISRVPKTTIGDVTTSRPTRTLVDDGLEDELSLYALLASNNSDDPTSYSEAINSPNKDEWHASMLSEINDLNKLNTWELVELPKGRTAVKGRWVYKTKRDPYGKLIKFKSRWVAKGFKQVLGLDYDDTFSNTCRPETWRSLFYIAAYKDWEIEQIDVKLAFPNSPIDKEIYVEQPTSFIVKGQEHKVCRLNTALYGLKQASRQ